ncbi:MAG TPA: alpha/beta hydrolase [Burkholderiales bacterium]|nr:alpha/beta hydrolase [Burkholderiales bacterium]
MPIRPRRIVILFAGLSMVSTAIAARNDAVDRYFDASDGARLHYLEAGQGSAIVFVPGWTMPAEIWQPQLAHFSKKYRVIAFDPRGHGKSAVTREGYDVARRARDLGELIERLNEPVVLVGWSLGVLESLAYVELVGAERVRSLVLVDNSIGEEPPPSFDPTFLSRLKQNRTTTTERFVRNMYRSRQDETYLRRIIDSALRVPTPAAVALLSYPYPRERWKKIVYATDRPILYAVTARFIGQAQNLQKNHPKAQIEVFESAGHALFVDESERFNRVLEQFIAQQTNVLGDKQNNTP